VCDDDETHADLQGVVPQLVSDGRRAATTYVGRTTERAPRRGVRVADVPENELRNESAPLVGARVAGA
jgi:hypothetical protein